MRDPRAQDLKSWNQDFKSTVSQPLEFTNKAQKETKKDWSNWGRDHAQDCKAQKSFILASGANIISFLTNQNRNREVDWDLSENTCFHYKNKGHYANKSPDKLPKN